MMELRPYQQDLIDRTRMALREHRRVIIQSPTGSGKTCLSATMMHGAAAKKVQSLFIVHRRELIDQTAATFDEAGIGYSFCAAGREFKPDHPVLICSIDTLRNRFEKVGDRKLIVWDECHHTAANTWAMVQDHFKTAFHVGLTATPKRLDGKGLKEHFDFIVLGPKIRWLIEQGYLADYVAYCRPVPDLSKVATRMGDYAIDELAEQMMKARIVGDAVEHYQRLCPGKRAVVFCVNIQHSEVQAQAFRDAGITCASLDGTTELWRRKETVDKFRSGEISVLCNCNLFSEGFDLPAMEAAILLRPTQSLTMYLQQVGRAMRPYPGKDRAIILDHAGNVLRHGAPCMEREWTLESKKKVAQEVHLKICPQCFAANPVAARTCSECGHVFNEVKETVLPDAVAGQLVALTPAQIEEARDLKKRELRAAKTMDELVALGTQRQYRNPRYWAMKILEGRAAWRSNRGYMR